MNQRVATGATDTGPTMADVDNPKCLACGHVARQHNLHGDRLCRVRVASGWSEQAHTFTTSRACVCHGYWGPTPAAEVCACEYVPTSNECVHCGKARVGH